MYKEIIGIIATLFIVIAFTLKGELKIRSVDLIGAVIFIVYGILIKSFSVIILNAILVLIQIYHIYKITESNLPLTKQERKKVRKFEKFLIRLNKQIKKSKNGFVMVNNHRVELRKNYEGDEIFTVYDNKLKPENYKYERILTKQETTNFLLEGAEIEVRT